MQKPWIVVTQAAPIAPSSSAARSEPASARRASSARIRWRSSAAARSVKVKARIASGGDALVADQAAVALHHHPGLAGARSGLEQDVVAGGRDRRGLLRRRRALSAHRSPPPRPPRSGARGRGGRSVAKVQKAGQTSWPRRPGAGAGVAADLAAADAGDDLPGPAARVGEQLLERLALDHVVVVEPVAAEVGGGLLGDDAARPAHRGPAQRVVEGADRRRAPVLGDGEQVERQLQLRPLLEASRAASPSRRACSRGRRRDRRRRGRPGRSLRAGPTRRAPGSVARCRPPPRRPPPAATARSRRSRARPPRRGSGRAAARPAAPSPARPGASRARARRRSRRPARARAPSRPGASRGGAGDRRPGARDRGGRGRRA